MLTINLLSSKEKKDITFEKTNITIISSFIILLTILILLSIVLYTIQDIQKNSSQNLIQQTDSIKKFLNQKNNKKIEEKIKEINYYLTSINKIEKEKTDFSKTLIEISEITPEKIRLFNIKLNKEEKKFEISGNASSRDGLLEFTERLNQSKYFKNIESPLSNLISPTNINFSLIGEICY